MWMSEALSRDGGGEAVVDEAGDGRIFGDFADLLGALGFVDDLDLGFSIEDSTLSMLTPEP